MGIIRVEVDSGVDGPACGIMASGVMSLEEWILIRSRVDR